MNRCKDSQGGRLEGLEKKMLMFTVYDGHSLHGKGKKSSEAIAGWRGIRREIPTYLFELNVFWNNFAGGVIFFFFFFSLGLGQVASGNYRLGATHLIRYDAQMQYLALL